MVKNEIEGVLKLRIAVAVLGEKNGWWNTNFFSDSSKSFLKFVFPRSKNSQFFSAFDVVRKKIDEKVGPNHFHLFRLSINYEEQIHNMLKDYDAEKFIPEENAKNLLNELSESLLVEGNPGPINIGNINELNSDLIRAFAAEYFNAFELNYESYPYLN